VDRKFLHSGSPGHRAFEDQPSVSFGVSSRLVSASGLTFDAVTAASSHPGLQPALPFGEAAAPPRAAHPLVEVRRSARRRRTVSAYRDGDRTVVLLPARMTRAEEQQWVATMLAQLEKREARARPSDDELMRRARSLSARHLDGRAKPRSVRWVDNQQTLWGSCTPVDRTFRLSRRLIGMPGYVIDYVLVHELAHLLEPGHDDRFWAWVDRYPRTERGRGFLEGVTATAGLDLTDGCETDPVSAG
jgi:predicted metal-dependent hydrolase